MFFCHEGQFWEPMGDCNVTGGLRSDRWLRCCIPTIRFGETFPGELKVLQNDVDNDIFRMKMLRRKKTWKTSGNFFQRKTWRIPLIKKTMSAWLLVFLGLNRCTLSMVFYQEGFGSFDTWILQPWWVGRRRLPCCAGINHRGRRGPDYECRELFAQKCWRLELSFLPQLWTWRTGFCNASFLYNSAMFINFPFPWLWEEGSQRKDALKRDFQYLHSLWPIYSGISSHILTIGLVVFAELYWVPGAIEQAEARAHRVLACSAGLSSSGLGCLTGFRVRCICIFLEWI